MEQTNINKIMKAIGKEKISKTEISKRTRIHPYLLDFYLKRMLEKKVLIEIPNETGKFVYYELRKK